MGEQCFNKAFNLQGWDHATKAAAGKMCKGQGYRPWFGAGNKTHHPKTKLFLCVLRSISVPICLKEGGRPCCKLFQYYQDVRILGQGAKVCEMQ